jgi:hypothetical protein
MPKPKLDTFTRAYLEAALWSSTDESTPSGGYLLDKNYGIEDFAPETLAKMIKDSADFQEKYWDWISSNLTRAGHDFWLSRNGHGAGFFDGDWPEHGDELQEAAEKYGNFDLYVGDDDQIHAMQENPLSTPAKWAIGLGVAGGLVGFLIWRSKQAVAQATQQAAQQLQQGQVTVGPLAVWIMPGDNGTFNLSVGESLQFVFPTVNSSIAILPGNGLNTTQASTPPPSPPGSPAIPLNTVQQLTAAAVGNYTGNGSYTDANGNTQNFTFSVVVSAAGAAAATGANAAGVPQALKTASVFSSTNEVNSFLKTVKKNGSPMTADTVRVGTGEPKKRGR